MRAFHPVPDKKELIHLLERDIVASIKAYLASLGRDVFFWKEHGGPYGTSGVPDIICCYKGRFIGMECKLPDSHLTELQKRALRKINDAGGYAYRVESVEDAREIIEMVDEEIEHHRDSTCHLNNEYRLRKKETHGKETV